MYIIYINRCYLQLMKLFVVKYTFDMLLEILSFVAFYMAWTAKHITFFAVMEDVSLTII